MSKIFSLFLSLQLMLSPVALAQNANTQNANTIDNYRVTGNGGRGFDFYVKQLMMLGSGIVGTNALTGTPDTHWFTLSPYVFGAGSVVLLSSEIAGALQKNRFHEKRIKAIKLDQQLLDQIHETGKIDKSMANTQLEAVNSMIEEETDNIEFMRKRMRWMRAVEIVYLSAVALAAIESIFCLSPPPPAGIDGMGYKPPIVGFKINNVGMGKTLKAGLYAAYFASPMLVNDLKNAEGRGTKGVVTGAAGAVAMSAVTGGGIKAGFTKLKNALDVFDDKVSGMLQTTMKTPYTRVATFGAFALTSHLVAEGLDDRMEQAEENKKKLLKLQADLKGVTATNTIAESDSTDSSRDTSAPDPLKRGKLEGLPQAEKFKVCEGKCLGDFKGKKLDFGKIEIPSIIHKSLGDAMAMADAVNNDDLGKADFYAGELTANAARVRGIVDQLLKKVDETAKKHGQKELDLKKEMTAQLNALSSVAQESARSAGVNPENGEKVELTPAEVAKDVVPPLATNQAPTPSDIGGDSAGGIFTEALPDSGPMDSPTGTVASDSLENYDSTVEDINKASDVSIFKQLSHRYILNYTKIFNRKKGPEEEAGKN